MDRLHVVSRDIPQKAPHFLQQAGLSFSGKGPALIGLEELVTGLEELRPLRSGTAWSILYTFRNVSCPFHSPSLSVRVASATSLSLSVCVCACVYAFVCVCVCECVCVCVCVCAEMLL